MMISVCERCAWQASEFAMTCYRGAGSSSSSDDDNDDDGPGGVGSEDSRGERLSFPARVVRGESVSCYVDARQLWDPHLQLVVTDCRFTTPYSANQTTLTYHFITDKYVWSRRRGFRTDIKFHCVEAYHCFRRFEPARVRPN